MRWLLLVALLSLAAQAAARRQPADSLSFLVLGDWGGQDPPPYTTPGELDVAAQLTKTAAINGSQFVLGVGDNFYYNGVNTSDSPRFNETFEDVFSSPILRSIPWYHIAGNHDHGGNVTAQTLYRSPYANRWVFPSEYYTFSKYFTTGQRNVSVLFVLTDSFDLDAGDPAQVAWIAQQLENSTSYDWVFVVGHYPVWSIGMHGSNPNLQRDVMPLLDKYKVAAYFSGHDHNIQHIRLSNSSVDYYVSGAGHTLEYWTDNYKTVPNGALKFFLPSSETPLATAAFVTVRVFESHMQVDCIDSLRSTVYSTTHTNPRAKLLPRRRRLS